MLICYPPWPSKLSNNCYFISLVNCTHLQDISGNLITFTALKSTITLTPSLLKKVTAKYLSTAHSFHAPIHCQISMFSFLGLLLFSQ